MHQLHSLSSAVEVPYNLAWVELDEGPLVTSSIVCATNEEIEVSRRVQVTFEQVTPGVTIPRFRLA